jgi:hypothetical protein
MARGSGRRWRLPLFASSAGLVVLAFHLAAIRHDQLEVADVAQVVAVGTAVLAVLLSPFWWAAARDRDAMVWWWLLFAGLALQGGAAAILFISRERTWQECGGFCELGASIDTSDVVALLVVLASMLAGAGILAAAWIGVIVTLVVHHGGR